MTIGELKALLESYPDTTEILVCGPDSGGYDWTYMDSATIEDLQDSKTLFLKGVGNESELQS